MKLLAVLAILFLQTNFVYAKSNVCGPNYKSHAAAARACAKLGVSAIDYVDLQFGIDGERMKYFASGCECAGIPSRPAQISIDQAPFLCLRSEGGFCITMNCEKNDPSPYCFVDEF